MSGSPPPTWRDSRCTRYRNRYGECGRCAQACPHGAIELHDAGIRIDPERCRHCALCIDACLTNALESPAYQPIAMLRAAIGQRAWRVACARSGASADTVLPCLGALGPIPMAYLARRGIALSLHGAAHCDDCEHGPGGGARLESNLRAVEQLRDAVSREGDANWALPTRVDDAPAKARSGPATSRAEAEKGVARRQWLRGVAARVRDDLAQAAGTPATVAEPAPPRAIRAGAYFVPEQRELLSIVCQRADGVVPRVPLDEALPLMDLELQAGCNVCEACFRVCPTGALGIDENPGDWTLTFQVERCVGCQVCLEVCQRHVLDARPEVQMHHEAAARPLLSLTKQRCTRCDRFFVSAQPESHCKVCGDDEDAFAAIFG